MTNDIEQHGTTMAPAEWEATRGIRRDLACAVGALSWGRLTAGECDAYVREAAGSGVRVVAEKVLARDRK